MKKTKKQNYLYKKILIMRGYFGLGQLSSSEKQDILSQHKSIYNGYQTMQPQVSNTQPLTVYDFAGDKEGMVVNNKGEVKKYTNVGINEQVQKEVCDECGSMMMEGECTECGWKGDMGEGTGKLDDIYDEEDLNPKSGFDYIEGSSNDINTFEEMDEQGYTGGGNAPDMDVSNIKPAYDFVSNGPDEVYPESEMDEQCLDCVEEYETMESAWFDDDSEEEDFGFATHSGDFGDDDSEEEDFGFATHSGDFGDDDSEEDEWEEIDEDLQESFISQKNRVMEMMNRMKVIK